MGTPHQCPSCGSPLPAEAPQGLCPPCLLRQAMGTSQPPKSATLVIGEGDVVATLFENGSPLHDFSGYELLEEIARGGMGVVWRARQRSLNRIVALKMILSGRLAGDAEVIRFRTEAQAAAKLSHPNIVAIHEVGAHEGQNYFSMEFVEGQSLAEKVFHGPLPPALAAKYLQAIAGAIHYAHQRGVVHRDLKPSNVLIDHAGEPRVTDFGLAKLIESDSGVTHSGAVMGSPSYMSPEQAAGRTREVGPASDVYSLGAILYELITGRPPFRAATPLDTMKMVVDSEPAAPKWVNPAVPADLETICLKCLEKDARRRYATAQELADDLNRFLRHEPVQARPATRIYRVQKWAKRKPAIAALAAVIVLAVLVVVGGVLRYGAILKERDARLQDRLRLTLIEQARAERLLGHREAALQRIADAAAIQHTPELRTEAIQAIAQPGVRRLFAAPVDTTVSSQFSLDGKLFAIGGEGYVPPDWPGYASNAWRSFVRAWEVPGGKMVAALPWHVEGGPFAVSPDARMLVVPQFDEESGVTDLALWDVSRSKVTARLPVSGAASFSPDGERLVVQEPNRVILFIKDGDKWKPGPRYESAAAVLAWTARDELLLQRLAWPGREEELVKRRSTNDAMRLIRWNVATGRQTFPINDGGFIRVRSIGVYPTREGYGPDTEEVIALSADGRAVATHRVMARSIPEEMFIRELDTGKQVGVVRPSPFPEFAPEFPETVLLSELGRRLIFRDRVEPGRLRVYDVNSDKFLVGVGEPGVELAPAFYGVAHGGMSSSGTSGWGTNFMRHESRQLRWWTSNRPSTNGAWLSLVRNFSPDGTLFAANIATSERNLALWEIDSSRRFAVLPNAWNPVWSADSRWLAVETYGMLKSGDGSSRSANFGQVVEVLHGVPTHRLPNAPTRLAFSPDGGQLTANARNWGGALWDVERSGDRVNLHVRREKLEANEIFFAPTAAWALNPMWSSSGGLLALAQRLVPGEELFGLTNAGSLGNFVMARALAPDGRRLLLALNPPNWLTNSPVPGDHFELWDLAERRRVAAWPHPATDPKYGSGWQQGPLVFSPDGRRIASACYGASGIELWDVASGKRLHELHPPQPATSPPPRPSFFRQMKRAIFRAQAAPLPTSNPSYFEYSVAAIVFTPDSRLVISCAQDRAVIREVESGRELAQCRSTTNMLSLAISLDGRTLATGDQGNSIRLWEIPSGRELVHWPAHDAAVTALTFSPDGATLASGARDSTMKLWNLPFIRRELGQLGLDW